jgi:hypothetical protein
VSEEAFDQLLADLKNPRLESPLTPTHYLEELGVSDEEFRQTCIKITTSGIFYKGALKGKKLPVSGPPDYKIYEITNLRHFVRFIAVYLWEWGGIEYTFEEIADLFDTLLNIFDRIAPFAQSIAKIKEKRIYEDIGPELKKWRNLVLAHFASCQAETCGQSNQSINPDKYAAECIADHILRWVPEAPNWTIAERVNDLLRTMGRGEMNFETLRKYIDRERRKINVILKNAKKAP